MLRRDRLLARLAAEGPAPDYSRLAADVLGIHHAPPELARKLISQALVVEDRLEAWLRVGARLCAAAPEAPAVYVLRDASGRALYVGKANNLRRRLRTHFSRRRWAGLKAELTRAVDAEWVVVGSELEALLREAEMIEALAPIVNVQIGEPDADARTIPRSLRRDVIVVAPSIEADSAELIAARVDGEWMIQRTRRDGADLIVHAARLMRFFRSPLRAPFDARALAPVVFSWLAHRGASATRLDPHDVTSARDLRARLTALLGDERLFAERIVVIDSTFRKARRRGAGAPTP